MWSHSNIRLPGGLDRPLRHLLVTPDMHRVHHSVIPCETHSNFGFNLACWDRLFGTYRDAPEAGHRGMTIGLPGHRSSTDLRLTRMLLMPFRRPLNPGEDR
jgi:sterol desaturase/sphingolipid hydroxylase (fatty acid hydroxylase superfamily)